MKKVLLVAIVLALTHGGFFLLGKYSGSFGSGSGEEGDDDLIYIVGVKEENYRPEMNAEYFAQKAFGPERARQYQYRQEGYFAGYKGAGFSQKPLPTIALSDMLLSFLKMQ